MTGDPIHGLRLTFDGGGVTAKLLCPASGCQPPGYCSECGRTRGDEQEPCDCCVADNAIFCNAKEWCEAQDIMDMIVGEVTISVEISWDSDDGPTLSPTGVGAA
jgi:hypothetical protein